MADITTITGIDEMTDAAVLSVTPVAAAKIQELLVARNIPGHALRVFVAGGGCSGLQYGMSFVDQPEEFDTLIEQEGVRLVIDPTSIMYLGGSTIDFVDSLMGGGFRVDNPDAVSTWGCGHSVRPAGESRAAEESAAGGCGSCSSN